ncbi:MAG TPA: DUF2130 domain-containing protein [Nitrosopumilaceae archaeon]|nr:DUF2130 domain-containing protein [Nitrosopumilaceae archaeon]
MEQKNNQIECPSCRHSFDAGQALYGKISEEIKTDFNTKISAEKRELESKLRNQITLEKDEELASYKQELERKSEQVREFNRTKSELERTKREMTGLKEQISAEWEQKMTLALNDEKTRIKRELDTSYLLKVSEKEHIIDQLKEQLSIASRKAEQGSMQIQGEVQEELLESWLMTNFPLDTIQEIKKGARGADCIQVVNSRTHLNCGKIYYESKRTKEFSNTWIEKFRADMREIKADFGVLVTDAFPKGIERMTLIDGIWVCSMEEFKGLCFVLRESVLLLNNYAVSQENKGEKMHMLYDYLIGTEFRQQVEAIVEGFTQMNTDLNSEKRAIESIWKRRSKQIEKVLLNTSHMFASVKELPERYSPLICWNCPTLTLKPMTQNKLKQNERYRNQF